MLQIGCPFFYSKKYYHTLLLIGGQALVPSIERFTEVENWVSLLHENNPHANITCIRLNYEWLSEIWHGKDLSYGQDLFERVKGILLNISPLKYSILIQ